MSGQSEWFSQQTCTCSCFIAAGAPSDIIIQQLRLEPDSTRRWVKSSVSHFVENRRRALAPLAVPPSAAGGIEREQWDARVRTESVAGDNRGAELTEVLCLSANKLFNTAGVRTDFAEGLAHSLNCINNRRSRESIWENLLHFSLGELSSQGGAGLCHSHACMSCRIEEVQCVHVRTAILKLDYMAWARQQDGMLGYSGWVMMIWRNDCWTKFITVWTSWCWQLGYKILSCVIYFLFFFIFIIIFGLLISLWPFYSNDYFHCWFNWGLFSQFIF